MNSRACPRCIRRGWLLAELGVLLDYRGRDPNRLLELFELDDETLIAAIAGRRRQEVTERWRRFTPQSLPADGRVQHERIQTICHHQPNWPASLGHERLAPRALHLRAESDRLAELADGATVAIVGSTRASDYGAEMARMIARGLAASGVRVVSAFAEGVSAAALTGALEGDGRPIAVLAGGVDVCKPAHMRALYERLSTRGCLVAELPCGFRERRWCGVARTRVVAALAPVSVVVEAHASVRELLVASVAGAMNRTVAAVPGRVSAPTAAGTCQLLRAGAPLVRDARDVLDLLHQAGATDGAPERAPACNSREGSRKRDRDGLLAPALERVLEEVAGGRDTLGRLTARGGDLAETMLALSQLELMGLLGRGDGGRYVPREPLCGESIPASG
ncbi:MAG TPA: DNA-processing protein DprA [Solirubrobacteraceae bacterium]|nr:DNA-processing protein DprA [Solirubrobacteraceae bacterium]